MGHNYKKNKKFSVAKTKKHSQIHRHSQKQTRKINIHHGGNAQPTAKADVCSKNINNLLIGEFRTNPNMLGSDPKNFANDIKKEANVVKNVASGNWLSLPGPPPKFPSCSVM